MSKPRAAKVRAPRSGSLGGGPEHPQVGTAPANRTAQIRTASAILPTESEPLLAGRRVGDPLSNVSRIATPHSTTLVLSSRLFVKGEATPAVRPIDSRRPRPSSGHSPPALASGCPPAGGCRLCSGAPPPPASRSSPCATPAGGFSPAPSAMGRSDCSGATGARPPVTSPPTGPSGATRPPPRSPGPNAAGRAGAGRAAAPTGYLPIGKSVAAATLNMAKNAAVTIKMIFMMLIPRRLDTRTVDRVRPEFAPLASSSRAILSTAAFLILRRARRGALQHS